MNLKKKFKKVLQSILLINLAAATLLLIFTDVFVYKTPTNINISYVLKQSILISFVFLYVIPCLNYIVLKLITIILTIILKFITIIWSI